MLAAIALILLPIILMGTPLLLAMRGHPLIGAIIPGSLWLLAAAGWLWASGEADSVFGWAGWCSLAAGFSTAGWLAGAVPIIWDRRRTSARER